MATREEILNILEKGVKEKRKGQYLKALSIYAEANKLDPENIWTYYNPGKVLFLMGNYIEAIENYKRAAHISIVNMLNRIDNDDPDGIFWLMQINEKPVSDRRKFGAFDKNAVFLLIDINTPKHLGRALWLLNRHDTRMDIEKDMDIYSAVLKGDTSEYPDDKLDEEIFAPLGRDYLLKNINWNEVEYRNLDVDTIY